MIQLPLKSLVGKLNDTCRQTLEAAAGLCLSRTNYNVELEHWLLKLIERPDTDLAALFRFYEVDVSRLTRDLTKAIDRLKTGNAKPPGLAQSTVDLIREGWLVCSVQFFAGQIRSGHLLCALLSDDSLSRSASDFSPELEKISPESLRKDLPDIVANTSEASNASAAGADGGGGGAAGTGGQGDRAGRPRRLRSINLRLT